MGTTVRIRAETKSKLRNISRTLAFTIEDLVDDTAQAVKEYAQLSMLEPKSGRIYMSHGRPHQASAPGQAPAVDVGTLIGSLEVDKSGPYEAYCYTRLDYAEYLEDGTRHMLPRPFMRPAARKAGALVKAKAGIKVKVAVSRASW
jgi:HK97 gp10 family phage protein